MLEGFGQIPGTQNKSVSGKRKEMGKLYLFSRDLKYSV